MPLVRFDMIKGRSEKDIKEILDLTQEAVVNNFGVHERDRYQIVTQHEPYEMNVMDTGLGFERSEKVLILSVTSRPRSRDSVQSFYKEVAEKLDTAGLVAPNDLMINFKINSDVDWSFGFGKAQFLTNEL